MKKLALSVGLSVALSAALAIVVLAQAGDSLLSFVQPFVIDIQQEVPVVAEVEVPIGDGGVITSTVPLTVEVALQVRVSSALSASIIPVSPTAPADIAVAMPEPSSGSELVDTLGIPYELIGFDGLYEVVEWTTISNVNGWFNSSIVIERLTDNTRPSAEIVFRFYDDDGVVIGVESIAPFTLSIFDDARKRLDLSAIIDVDRISSYTVEYNKTD